MAYSLKEKKYRPYSRHGVSVLISVAILYLVQITHNTPGYYDLP